MSQIDPHKNITTLEFSIFLYLNDTLETCIGMFFTSHVPEIPTAIFKDIKIMHKHKEKYTYIFV